MEAFKAEELSERLQWENQDYWMHLEAASPLEKYPAKQHAQRVAQKLQVSHGLIYLQGAPLLFLEDSDQPRRFRQRRYFYYMSGVDEPDCHITYDIGNDWLTLYIPEINPRQVIWNGRGSTIAEAYDKYDVDAVCYSNTIRGLLEDWAQHSEGPVYILHPDQGLGFENSPHFDSAELQKAMDQARTVKDDHEIKLIRKANEITAQAHRKVLSMIRGLRNEAQVEAVFLNTCVSEDAKHQAYEIIAASGENASILHYVKNNEPLEGRQLMCLDAGCEWQCYASDVTRTFPISGSWPTPESKAIHDLVQEMQTACIEKLRPGVRYLDLHLLAHKIAIRGLLKLGILHGGTFDEIYQAGTSLAFFPHGLGHHVGLEVHDVSDAPLMSASTERVPPVYQVSLCKRPEHPLGHTLEEGMVLTVEPGIYFSRYALSTIYLPSPIHSKFINEEVLQKYLPVGGVRIEDDVLVTANGYEILSKAPKGDEMLSIIRGEGDLLEGIESSDASQLSLIPFLMPSQQPNLSNKLAAVEKLNREDQVNTMGTLVEPNTNKSPSHLDLSSEEPITQTCGFDSSRAHKYPTIVGDIDDPGTWTEYSGSGSSMTKTQFLPEARDSIYSYHQTRAEGKTHSPHETESGPEAQPPFIHETEERSRPRKKIPTAFARLASATYQDSTNQIMGQGASYARPSMALSSNTPDMYRTYNSLPKLPNYEAPTVVPEHQSYFLAPEINAPNTGPIPTLQSSRPYAAAPASLSPTHPSQTLYSNSQAIPTSFYTSGPRRDLGYFRTQKAPEVPQKLPKLPQKPLAYRHSLPCLRNPGPHPPREALKHSSYTFHNWDILNTSSSSRPECNSAGRSDEHQAAQPSAKSLASRLPKIQEEPVDWDVSHRSRRALSRRRSMPFRRQGQNSDSRKRASYAGSGFTPSPLNPNSVPGAFDLEGPLSDAPCWTRWSWSNELSQYAETPRARHRVPGSWEEWEDTEYYG